MAAVALVALGSFNYVLNQRATGDPLGELRELTDRTSPVVDNAARGAWSLVHTPGIESRWFNIAMERPALRLFSDLTTEQFSGFTASSSVNEDTSAYGVLGMLTVALLVLVALGPKTRWDRRVLAIAGLGYIATYLLINEQTPWVARLMMPGFAIGAPLLAYLYTRGAVRGAAVALAVVG